MSEMTIANKKLMLAGLYLSKFDVNKEGLKALGFKTLQEAYSSFALAVGGKPASVKNYMQEFDPYFPNTRQGWHKREIRQTRQDIMNEFGGLNIEEFSELVRAQFAGSLDKEFKMAHYLSSRFFLYVVTDFAHTPKPRIIENPLDAGIAFEERAVKSEQRVWVAQIAA